MRGQIEELQSWENVYARLSEFVAVAARAGSAIADGDAPAARVLVHETRAIRAALLRAHHFAQAVPIPRTPAGLSFLRKLKELRSESEAAARIASAWIGRSLPDDKALATVEGGYLAIADRLLPPTWDVTLDVVALIGHDTAELCQALRAFGQERIVVYGDETFEDAKAGFPDGVIGAAERAELGKMMEFAERPPERLKCYAADESLEPEDLNAKCRDIEESFGTILLDRNTVTQFGALWLEQGLANLPAIAGNPSVADAGDRFEGIPMVIVAPGPSLSKNVELLAELEGRAIVATFSHTLSALRAAGIRPNIVLAVDMEDLRYHFDDYPIEELDALALGLTVHPDLFETDAKLTLSLAGNGRVDDWLCAAIDQPEMKLSSGGSVAHTAFSLARRWGCNPIVLVGQDLSFPGGKVYCDSNVDGATTAEVSDDGTSLVVKGWSDGYANLDSIAGRRETPSEPALRIPANGGGGEVVTSTVFALFRRWFIDTATELEETDLFNCTEGGAHIDGFNHISLREFIDTQLSEVEPRDIAAEFAELGRSDIGHRQTKALSRAREIRTAIGRSEKAARKCLGLASQASTRKGKAKRLAQLANAEKKLTASLGPISFIALAAQAEVHRGRSAARDQVSIEDNLNASRRLFAAIRDSCARFSHGLADVIAILEQNE